MKGRQGRGAVGCCDANGGNDRYAEKMADGPVALLRQCAWLRIATRFA